MIARDSLPETIELVSTVAGSKSGPGQLLEPAGISVDAFGRLFVSDASLHRIQRYDAHGARLGETGGLGSDRGQLRRPGALATLGTLSIAVLDDENRRVLSYDLFGRLNGTLIDFEDPALQDAVGRIDPVGLASDRGGALYVPDAERDRIVVFDFSGRYARTVGGYGVRPGSFHGLAGVAVGRRGELVTVERAQARVQRLDASGRVLATWPIAVKRGPGRIAVAVQDTGRVAVADEQTGKLWVFDLAGVLRSELSGLARPRALAFAPDGTLLVVESGAGRITRFALAPRDGRREP